MKKIIIPIFVILILVGGLVSAVLLVRQRQIITKKAAPATTLSLAPSNANPTVGDSVTASIDINTGENLVIGAELYINFDASRLQVTDVNLGPFFVNPQIQTNTTDNNTGRITYILFLPTGSTPQQGQGTLATISFVTKADGLANVNYDGSSLIAAVGQDVGNNVLLSSSGADFNVSLAGAGSEVSTPTNTPTNTPTDSPTNTPTNTPTMTPTATPTDGASSDSGADSLLADSGGNITPTNTPTMTPTATSTPRPTSTPTPTTSGQGSGGTASTPTPTVKPTSTPTLGALANANTGSGALPVAGISFPTLIGLGMGAFLILLAVLLAL